MILQFVQKSVYGNTLYYPYNAAAMAITTIANKKTLKWSDIKTLDNAQYEVEIGHNTSFNNLKNNADMVFNKVGQ